MDWKIGSVHDNLLLKKFFTLLCTTPNKLTSAVEAVFNHDE